MLVDCTVIEAAAEVTVFFFEKTQLSVRLEDPSGILGGVVLTVHRLLCGIFNFDTEHQLLLWIMLAVHLCR